MNLHGYIFKCNLLERELQQLLKFKIDVRDKN